MKALVILCALVGVARADDGTAPMAQETPSGDTSGLGFDPETVYKVPRGASPTEGPASAPVTIVTWSDFACEYCITAQHTLDQLRLLYPGQIRFVHRTLPLDEDNLVGAEAAMAAAAQGSFVPMKERLYAQHGHADRAGVELIARELGLDMARFRADLDTGVYRPQIAIDTREGRALGVSGTPAFFVNGRALPGAMALRVFTRVIDEELARGKGSTDYDALVASGEASANVPKGTHWPKFHFSLERAYRMGLGLPGHQQGPDDAPITIVEWSDFQCPYCAKEAPRLAQVRAKYGDKVRLVYRHYPVAGHPDAQLAAEAGIAAADQGKFWAFHDQIFAPANFGHATRADLDTYARAIGLDLAAFDAALDSRHYRDIVETEQAAAAALGVDGTPTMFINGMVVSGARDEAQLEGLIDLQLEGITKAIAHGLAAKDVYPLVMTNADGEERSDPMTIPAPSDAQFAARASDRLRGVIAACRRHDDARAKTLAAGLSVELKARAVNSCIAFAVDL